MLKELESQETIATADSQGYYRAIEAALKANAALGCFMTSPHSSRLTRHQCFDVRQVQYSDTPQDMQKYMPALSCMLVHSYLGPCGNSVPTVGIKSESTIQTLCVGMERVCGGFGLRNKNTTVVPRINSVLLLLRCGAVNLSALVLINSSLCACLLPVNTSWNNRCYCGKMFNKKNPFN